MLPISVGIELIFTERPYLDRIDAVADSGLRDIELWGWRDKDIAALRERCQRRQVEVVVLNLDPPVNVLEGKALSVLEKALVESCQTAQKLGCRQMTTHLQEVPNGGGGAWYSFLYDERQKSRRLKQKEHYLTALKKAAPIAADHDITLLLEPLNTLVDHNGYFLSSSQEAVEIIRQINHSNLRLLFDCYHQQVTEGNLISNLTQAMPVVAHIHVADVPGRHEPGTGEIHYGHVLTAARQAGYQGYIGIEYIPSGDAISSMKLIREIAATL
jgi:hydroxypyruvate isomerase